MPNKSKKRATSIYSAPKIKRAWYTYALVVAVFGLLTWGYITYVWNFIFEWMFLHPQSNINHILLGMIYFVGGTGLFSLLVTSYYKVVFLHPGPVPAEWKLSEQELRDLQKKNFDSIRQRAEAVNKRAAQANATPAEPAPVEEEDDEEHSDKKALLHNSSETASSSSAPNANNESESSPEVVSHQEEEAEHHHHHHKRQVSEFKHDGSIRICTYCKLQKPDRSHHCSSCGTCVLKMDHHCPWINNCVGFHNYKFFLLFLIYTSVCALFFNFTTMFKFLNIFRIDGPAGTLYYPSLGDFNLAFVFFISFFFGFSVAIFFLFHLKLVFDNQTTLESMEKNRKILRQHDGRNPYDEGWTRNFQSVFGTKWQYWLLPTLESVPGDGVTFPIFRKRDDQV